jgi:tetratricopeptide (TPR) repeat protein
LAISYSKLGSTQSSLGNLEKALEYFEKYNQLEKELCAAYPNNVGFKNGLAISYSKLGETQSSLGNLEKALEYFEKYNQLEKELYADFPNNVEYHFHYAFSLKNLGAIYTQKKGLSIGKPYFEQAYQLFQTLYAKTQTPKYFQEMKMLEMQMQGLNLGCVRFFFIPLQWLLKIPYIKRKLLELKKSVQKDIQEEYKNQK